MLGRALGHEQGAAEKAGLDRGPGSLVVTLPFGELGITFDFDKVAGVPLSAFVPKAGDAKIASGQVCLRDVSKAGRAKQISL